MNIPLVLAGSIGSVLVILFIFTAVKDGIRVAFEILCFIVALLVAVFGLITFWVWVGGGFS